MKIVNLLDAFFLKRQSFLILKWNVLIHCSVLLSSAEYILLLRDVNRWYMWSMQNW